MGGEEPILMVHESMREKIPIVSYPCDEDSPGMEVKKWTLTEADLRSSWEQLTQQDGKWVIFEPCAPENFSLSWKADTLIIGWGFDATMDVITRINSNGDSFSLDVIELNSIPPDRTFRVVPVDTEPGLAHWWFPNEKEPRLLVRDGYKEEYPIVKEPCEKMLQEMEDAAKKK